MKLSRIVDRCAFFVTVISAGVAAIAGGSGWAITSVVAGCIAAIAPIVGRVVADQDRRRLLPRQLSAKQGTELVERLKDGAPLSFWLAHNRMEAEPAAFHAQLFSALKNAGHDLKWFGGMNNATIGIEIAGPDSPEKNRLMAAFQAADIEFVSINLSDDTGNWGLSVWIGANPGLRP